MLHPGDLCLKVYKDLALYGHNQVWCKEIWPVLCTMLMIVKDYVKDFVGIPIVVFLICTLHACSPQAVSTVPLVWTGWVLSLVQGDGLCTKLTIVDGCVLSFS